MLVVTSGCHEEEPPQALAPISETPTASAPPSTLVSTDKARVALRDTEAFDVASTAAGRDYRIFVALPAGYAETTRAYPVLFMGDANGEFGMVTEIARGLALSGDMPDLVIVGIGYPTDDNDEILNLRIGDFTPTYINPGAAFPGEFTFPQSGRASKFLTFLREELMPRITAEYRVDPGDLAFLGHSAGGLFGLYVMFTHPETFGRYIIASPEMRWDDWVIRKFEQKYADEHTDLAARVFITVGSLDTLVNPNDVQDLWEELGTRDYPSLVLVTHIFEGETHYSALPATLARGLRAIYENSANL